ncbi:hypothetical protein [Streptomyces sp. NPDC048248]|uniref:hypothetical protein n=1 Tax=Streptomyces sp. NPDC048248 TaxID=3365523 RepID=UPI003719BB0A
MSTTPEPESAESSPAPESQQRAAAQDASEQPAAETAEPATPPAPASPPARPAPRPAALIFDDPLSRQSSDDTDRGWGERPSAGSDSAADLARFLDEKPPHHL